MVWVLCRSRYRSACDNVPSTRTATGKWRPKARRNCSRAARLHEVEGSVCMFVPQLDALW